jgi:nonribosomal peptide synthetase MxcG
MLPKKVIQVDYIPLTTSGKIDTVHLLEMKGKNILEVNHCEAPIEVERVITNIWQQLLGTPFINPNQNIFDLGAHSLMLGEACALFNVKLNELGLKPVNIIDILSYPTISKLVEFTKEREKNKVDNLSHLAERAAHQRQVLLYRRPSHAIKS